MDVDALFAQTAKHLASDACVAEHANADDTDLADFGIAGYFRGAQLPSYLFLQEVDGFSVVIAVHRKAEVGHALFA